MSQKEKIKKILDSVKLEVEDVEKFETVIDSILHTFNEIKDVNVDDIDAALHRKKVTLKELRTDEAKSAHFREDLAGNYFTVPNVSKRNH
jgi:aspartyl/glutamyl-tRNA(Asn/Gln) amidotransferase C subunit